jgi:hypothetical protein
MKMLCRVTTNSASVKVCFAACTALNESHQFCRLRRLSVKCHLPTAVARGCFCYGTSRFKSGGGKRSDKSAKNINSLVQPVSVKPYNDLDGVSVGEELVGTLKKGMTLHVSRICFFGFAILKSALTPLRS